MNRHIWELSQRARLGEFILNESGAMSANKAAQMGAILATSALAGILMSARIAEACHSNPNPCSVPQDCAHIAGTDCRDHNFWDSCNTIWVCEKTCTNSTAGC